MKSELRIPDLKVPFATNRKLLNFDFSHETLSSKCFGLNVPLTTFFPFKTFRRKKTFFSKKVKIERVSVVVGFDVLPQHEIVS